MFFFLFNYVLQLNSFIKYKDGVYFSEGIQILGGSDQSSLSISKRSGITFKSIINSGANTHSTQLAEPLAQNAIGD